MDVSIQDVQAQVETARPQPAAQTQDAKPQGLTQTAHELRLQQRRASRISERLSAK